MIETIRLATDILESLAAVGAALLGSGWALLASRKIGRAGARKIGLWLAAALLLSLGVLFLSSNLRDQREELFEVLQRRDPILFSHATTNSFNIARVFPDRKVLASESDLKGTLAGANRTFDLLAVTGGATITEFSSDILEAIRRGVRVRFIFLDPDPSNLPNWELHARFTGMSPEVSRMRGIEFMDTLSEMSAKVDSDKNVYQGQFDVRYLTKPIVCSMWILDAEDPGGLAHIEARTHAGYPDWPSFRVSNKDGREVIDVLQREFETLWASATPLRQ